jgi:hypothetical protein
MTWHLKKQLLNVGEELFFASFVAKKYLSNVNKNKFEIFFNKALIAAPAVCDQNPQTYYIM